jgi:signal transduction histidine kinase
MGHPIPRIPQTSDDPSRRTADRARLLERVAEGLAHEGKNPLHNMMLHLQLMSDKLPEREPRIQKHLAALRDGIARVDALLRAFGEFASPEHLPPDLAAAAARALQLFTHEARRANVQFHARLPEALMVRSESVALVDLVAHALVASIEFAHDGGQVILSAEPRGPDAVLELRSEGGNAHREQALPYLDAARSLAPEAACELSIETPAAGGARLSLSFQQLR